MADPKKLLFSNPSYDGQLVRTVAAAAVHAADIGESLAAARRVGRLSGANWHKAWFATAERARIGADAALETGDRLGAMRAYLRSSEYYRQAYYYIRSDLDDAQLGASYRAHTETFASAAALMEHPAERVRIPYEGTTIAGYLFSPDRSGSPRPTVVFPCGYDSTAESGWASGVVPALERGYSALSFEGPGQGEALFVQRLYFRPDFEAVLGPVLDWLATRPEVNPDSLVLVGRSFGGYLAPRAAAFEHRLAALVCDPAQPDMAQRLPDGVMGRIAAPVVAAQMHVSQEQREFFGARMASHGLDSVKAYLAELRRFTMLADAESIDCPTLIIEAEHDFAGGSGGMLRDAMRAPVELIELTAAQGAGGHCAGLGQETWAQVVFGWIDRTLATR